MATFGIYQVLDPLYVTPGGSVCSAKIVGGEAAGRIAVKIFNPPKPDSDEPNWEPKYFLDRAHVQRHVAAAGGAHWAPIYASGFTPQGGAYYVTDYHALTAQKMIDGRVPVDATTLHAIVHSVLSGLEEIRRIGKRAHANLKAGNVLLVSNGNGSASSGELRAVLSDPGQEYKAQKEGEAGDLHAVGLLIHELVLHRRPTEEPSAESDEGGWQKLGDKADGWRQLCVDLLAHPITARVATLAGVVKAVEGLAPARLRVPHLRLHGKGQPQKSAKGEKSGANGNGGDAKRAKRSPASSKARAKLRRRVMQLVVVLLVIGGAIGILSMLEASARQELCAAREGWFGSLAAAMEQPQRRERFAADPHLSRVVEGVSQVQAAGVTCTPGDNRIRPLGFLQFMKARAAVEAIKSVERDLAPESWPELGTLRGLAKTFEQRGWQQPAGYVEQLLEGVRPTPTVTGALAARPANAAAAASTPGDPFPTSASFAGRVERMLRLRPIIETQAAAADPDWKRLDEQTTALASSTDPVVKSLGAFLRREAIGALRLTEEGFEGLTQLEQNAGLAMQMVDATNSVLPDQIDLARFDEYVVRPNINLAQLEPADVTLWLSQRPLYVVRRDEIAKAAEQLKQSFDTTRDDVAKSVPETSEAEAFKQEQTDVEAALKEFKETRFIERDITEGRLGKKVEQVQAQIDRLKRYYHAEDAADWLKNLAGFATTSDRLKSYWETWVAELRKELDSMSKDREAFARSKQRTDKLLDALTMLEISMPTPPAELNADFAAEARKRRELRLDELLAKIDIKNPSVNPDQLKQAADALGNWFDDLKALNEDFPLRKKLLTLDDRPDERWRKSETFFNDTAVQKLIRGDVERIEKLQKLRTANRKELVRAATTEGVRAEVVLAAWRMLGEGRINPGWPASTEELKTEVALRGRVAQIIEQLDSMERRPLDEELAREGPRRWSRFVESAQSEEMLRAAIDQREAFKATGVILAEMQPAARFNVWLYLANQAIRDNNPAPVPTVVENLRRAAHDLEGSANANANAAQVLDKLAKWEVVEPFARFDLGEVFPLDVRGVASGPIEFRRVEPKSRVSRPFYLATRELTVGQFIGAIDGMAIWAETRKLSWSYRPPKGDPRLGARTWEWVDATNPHLGVPALWMITDNRHNDFPVELHPEKKFNRNVISAEFGGMPSDRHPIQYLSGHAALFFAAQLGCRLPTSAEWEAALAESGKTVEKGSWNLRDQTWEIFAKHAAKEKIPLDHWPDRGAFPADATTASAKPLKNHPGNDGALLFRAATDNDGVFRDLVGNVAEFVCEVPDAFSRWENKRSADSIKTFLTDTPDAIAIIGGSALSPADQAPDKPIVVTRTDRGFSDVGLRLAFTAPARNDAERLKWALAGEDYLWPRAAQAGAAGAAAEVR